MKLPSNSPINYKTLSGLLKAVERVLVIRQSGNTQHIAGASQAMWLHNAAYAAQQNFNDVTSVQDLRKKFSISRPQDLTSETGGHSVFGLPLPTRDYIVGDNVPGVGLITEELGEQFYVGSQWFHKRCFPSAGVVL